MASGDTNVEELAEFESILALRNNQCNYCKKLAVSETGLFVVQKLGRLVAGFPALGDGIEHRSSHFGYFGGESGTGGGFVLVLHCQLSSLIPPSAAHSVISH
jgi:hypothetical protein